MKNTIIAVAAIGRNRELGKNGGLIWKINEDAKHFRTLTQGHPVIMGRKTWESLPDGYRPLPGRTNIVVTRQAGYAAPGAAICASIDEALVKAKGSEGADSIYIIGGSEVYRAALPHTDVLQLTLVDAEDANANSFFPEYAPGFAQVSEEAHSGNPSYSFVEFRRTT